ncbi:MAG TPA: anti-sigma factor [Vicinamibacterales bacterium]|jgi:anti-sigma-K factor RskA|nr:anti-sigma factor [Vicinamibacterales bacterium]
MSMHEELKANAAGYVLGSLDANDRQEFEAHLAGCAECAAEVASLRPVVSVLATTVPQVTPRAEVRDRILGVAAGLKPSSAGAGPPAPRRLYALHDRKAPPALVWLPLAAAIVIAVGAGIYALRLQRQVGALQARFDQAQSTTAVLAAPDLARIDLQGQAVAPDARARALWSRSRGLVFTAANLPPAPAGKTYQVWVVTAQMPISAGLLTTDPAGGGTQYYMTPPDIAPPVAVAVTLEPSGGVPSPMGERYLVGMP